ncbi:MAG: DUF2232 domain-containing protein [Gammaproteobacteria bacterium]|nr:DUF2232 domain-containing protein [Gammaproteobacteria bacterium]
MRAFVSFILRGRWHAMLSAIVAAVLSLLLPLLGHISGAIVSLVTLRNGAAEGIIVACGALLVLAGLGLVSTLQHEVVTTFLVAMGAVVWLPAVIIAAVHRQRRDYGAALAIAAGIGLSGILMMYIIIDDVTGWWTRLLEAVLMPLLADLRTTMPEAELKKLLENMAEVMTGLVAAMIVYSIMINLMIARWWQSLLFNPGGFRAEFLRLRLGRVATIVALIIIAFSMLGGKAMSSLAGNLVVLVVAVFSLQGLALLHAMIDHYKAHVGWLVGAYVLMLLLAPQAMVTLAALGLTDSWLDFRARWGSMPPPGDGRGQGDGPTDQMN